MYCIINNNSNKYQSDFDTFNIKQNLGPLAETIRHCVVYFRTKRKNQSNCNNESNYLNGSFGRSFRFLYYNLIQFKVVTCFLFHVQVEQDGGTVFPVSGQVEFCCCQYAGSGRRSFVSLIAFKDVLLLIALILLISQVVKKSCTPNCYSRTYRKKER